MLFSDEAGTERSCFRFNMLRQQRAHDDRDGPCLLPLADFVAPIGSGVIPDSHRRLRGDRQASAAAELAGRVRANQGDDYNAIMVKALADRCAEAYAELLHKRVRDEWGIGDGREMTDDDYVRERYRGIRPAFGYPACPDHSDKGKLFELLQARALGLDLTETFAMTPAASVSGIYFSHPQSRYFSVGDVGDEQRERRAAAAARS